MQAILEISKQNCLVFQPMYNYFKIADNRITSWESKGLSNEKS